MQAYATSGNLEWEWEVVHPMADTRQPELLRRRWVWGIGIGVVVVGAVVTTAVLLTQDSGTMTPVTGNAMPGVITW